LSSKESDNGEKQPTPGGESESGEEVYDTELSPVFVTPLNSSNQTPGSSLSPAPVVQDAQAIQAARVKGSDLRTTRLPDGRRVRLLTYRAAVPGGPELLQVGRLLQDQEQILDRFLLSLLALSALSIILLGIGSWWLSGRSLGPAQRAWDQQQAFISNASHELRTPLTLIRANAEYALRDLPEKERQSSLRDILQESDYMSRLVDDLLLLSRLDSQRLKLNREIVDLAALLEEACRQAEKLAQGKDIHILVDQDEGKVWADSMRLRQVLLILLDNAVRFTPAGGAIRLEAHQQGKQYQIDITDTGRGIPPEHLPHIFEQFYQVPGATGEDARSNGLGLSIAKALIEAQGGAIDLHSQVGQGTQAVISLPAVV
jgi:signal transduction histidine kinase